MVVICRDMRQIGHFLTFFFARYRHQRGVQNIFFPEKSKGSLVFATTLQNEPIWVRSTQKNFICPCLARQTTGNLFSSQEASQ